MMRPLLFIRITYMERYDGPGETYGGGSYIKEHGVGGEVFNFKSYRGRYYGYGMTLEHTGVNLNFLDDSKIWERGDEIDDVDVVFFARRPNVGQVVIGWYERATVYHKQYRTRRGQIPGIDARGISYFCDVAADRAYLLPESDRNFEVPLAAIDGKGFSGQANIWYPGSTRNSNPAVKRFTSKVRKYLYSHRRSQSLAKGPTHKETKGVGGKRLPYPDHAHNAAVEKAAVDFVWQTFRQRGFDLQSVENENCGWDLVAKRGAITLFIEVKGQSGPSIYFELTPNEYLKLGQHNRQYQICVVCEALDTPVLYEFAPRKSGANFDLVCIKPKITIPLQEKTGAVARETKI